jgi:hypothetical protein
MSYDIMIMLYVLLIHWKGATLMIYGVNMHNTSNYVNLCFPRELLVSIDTQHNLL